MGAIIAIVALFLVLLGAATLLFVGQRAIGVRDLAERGGGCGGMNPLCLTLPFTSRLV